MEITIKDKTISLRYSFRAFMIYENITKKSFNPQNMTDIILFFYSVIMASDKENPLELDDFLDWLDENPDSLNEFSKWLTSKVNQQSKLSPQQVHEVATGESKILKPKNKKEKN